MFKKSSNHNKKTKREESDFLKEISQEIKEYAKSFEKAVGNKIEDIGTEIGQEVQIVAKEIKKKIGIFYKIAFALLLTFSIVLSYFIILVSTEPKSFPFVTSEIRDHLKTNYGEKVNFDNAYLSFTKYGTLKVTIKDIKISQESSEHNAEKHEIIIPKIDTEFSILNLVTASFTPRKIKVTNPEITIENSTKDQSQDSQTTINQVLIEVLSKMKREELLTKSFELENAKIIYGEQKFWIKKSQVRALVKKDILYVSSTNKFSIGETAQDLNFNSSCQFNKDNLLKCDVFLVNFRANSIADLHPSLNFLHKIDAVLNFGGSFALDKDRFHNALLTLDSQAGSFFFSEFFGERLFFSDLSLKGEYNYQLGILNLKNIKTNFRMHNDADTANPSSLSLNTPFEMSLIISNFNDWDNRRSDFDIKLSNAPINELEKLWPVSLSDNGIRDWVISHIKNGVVKEASTKFSLKTVNQINDLEAIDASLNFVGADLKYSDEFPEIKKIDAVAKFNKNSMNVAINAGDVLGSKIYDSQVVIDDFSSEQVLLRILGKSKGSASDSLKHADKSSKFSAEVEKYLNGNSQNNFDIRIPLNDKIELKDCYIAVTSEISKLSNPYVKGDINAAVKKDLGSDDFMVNIDLTNSELTIKDYNIEKKNGAESKLNLAISFPSAKEIALKNIELWKKESLLIRNKKQTITAKISGEVKAITSPFNIVAANLKNENFGRNSYKIEYLADLKSSNQKLVLRGQVLDLATAIQNKFASFSSSGSSFKSSSFKINLDNLFLANAKAIKNFALNLKCQDQLCTSGFLKGSYNKKEQSLSLQISKKNEENFAHIDGQITDVGYMAEALGISNVISGGSVNLKLLHSVVDKNPTISGNISFYDSIVIYENPTVKKLATNSLFSKVRDKIFSEDKTIFDSMKIDFAAQNGVIDLQSLVANNYKIGITAKGKIDVANDIYDIKGMIVPGFIINNLFGIGKIPILGNVVGILTGGEGGGVFGIRYQYTKKKGDKEANFETSKVSSFVPTTIKNLFDLI